MGRYYVCIGVESQTSGVRDSARVETCRGAGEKAGDFISKDNVCASSSKTEGPPVIDSSLDSSATPLYSASNHEDEKDIMNSEIEREGYFLQENVNRLLECSGLSNLRLAPSPTSGTSWLPKLPEPLRALSPSNLVLEEPTKRCDETARERVCDEIVKETVVTSDYLHQRLEEVPSTESHQHEIEVEWEDPSLRDVYPFLRQGYSTEKKAWKNRSKQTETD